MKTYLKNNLPKISIVLIIVFFISDIGTTFDPQFGESVLLYPSNLLEPLNWYRLVTYPLYVGGLSMWLLNSGSIILAGFIIENRVKKRDMAGLILLSSIIGGLVYIILNQEGSYNRPIASPTMISWGYWSATIIIGLKYWRTLNLFEKIIMIWLFLSVYAIWNENLGFFIGQLSVIITIAILTIIIDRKSNRPQQAI